MKPKTHHSTQSTHAKEGQDRVAPAAAVVYEAIRAEGTDEIERSFAALAWSGLAAGLSMGFSLVAQALLQSHLPDAQWRPLISKFGYCVGFLIVILGRQQLFTENTLTPILPMLSSKRPWAMLPKVLRLWIAVLVANVVGACFFAWVLAHTDVLDDSMRGTLEDITKHAFASGFWTRVLRGIFAGWLIALLVWLLPFAETARITAIVIITYFVGLGGFDHIVAGSTEAFYIVAIGKATVGDFFTQFCLPVLLGNIVGGILLVAVLNHAQVRAGEKTTNSRGT